MSILKKAAVFGVVACASALGLAAQASAQTNVYVQVSVAPHAAPVHAGRHAHYAPHHAQPDVQTLGVAPCPHQAAQHAQGHAPPAPASDAHVLYNRPHTGIADVQPYNVYAPQPHYEANVGHYVESRQQSRWR